MLCEITINEKCDPEDAQCVGQYIISYHLQKPAIYLYHVYTILGQTPEEDGEGGLSKGALVGIVIFCIFAVIFVTVTIIVGVRHVQKSGKHKTDSQVCNMYVIVLYSLLYSLVIVLVLHFKLQSNNDL